ncbi:hypothetical protein Moror_6656 [Moniliophthora roreri MCA 2997]|uniref:Uncharacterized protein n=1 Tax=Moniliophthora roreri (strain MCA 2997) TaxID=1381753 RepID=V2YYL6_MONRO|nr:hypothetical protein Moror_6656 [Moniliophthora roreri MCA 2997]
MSYYCGGIDGKAHSSPVSFATMECGRKKQCIVRLGLIHTADYQTSLLLLHSRNSFYIPDLDLRPNEAMGRAYFHLAAAKYWPSIDQMRPLRLYRY